MTLALRTRTGVGHGVHQVLAPVRGENVILTTADLAETAVGVREKFVADLPQMLDGAKNQRQNAKLPAGRAKVEDI